MNVDTMRVMLVEDNPGDVDLVREALSGTSFGQFEIDSVDRLSTALLHMDRRDVDAVLLDLSLPDSSGLGTLVRLHEGSRGQTPIVVLTGSADRSLALQALERGAEDYLVKGQADGESLARSLRYALERRESHDRLKRSEARLARAQAIARVGCWEWDIASNRVSYSDEMRRLFGLVQGTLPDTIDTYLHRVHEDDRVAVREALQQLLGGERPVEYEHRYVRADGTVLHVRAHAASIETAGKVTGVVGTAQDVSERKKLEGQHVFAARMAAVGTLAAGAANEISSPLAYVTGNLDYGVAEVADVIHRLELVKVVMSRDPASLQVWEDAAGPELTYQLAEVRAALSEARQGTARIRRLVHGLQVFSRADEPKLATVYLGKVLDGAIRVAEHEIRKRACLVKDFADVHAVRGDEARLGQVFMNLLLNAAQAIPEGHPYRNMVRVATRAGGPSGVIVEVQDTGCGIPENLRDRIFDPFFTTRPEAGTGLGLSVCRGIVTALGGEIEVESSVGKGSLFRVLLPKSSFERKTGEGQGLRPAGSRGRILAIASEPLELAALRQLLGKAHDLVLLDRAGEALDALATGERFDLILCDLAMPSLSGMEFYRELSGVAPEQAKRVVFLTGGSLSAREQEFLRGVPNARVKKPFDRQHLRALVRILVR